MNIIAEGSLKLSNVFIHPGYIASSPTGNISTTAFVILVAGITAILIIIAHIIEQAYKKRKEPKNGLPPPD